MSDWSYKLASAISRTGPNATRPGWRGRTYDFARLRQNFLGGKGIIQRFALALPNGFALRCGYSRRAAELRSHPRFWPRRTFQFFSLSGFQLFLGGKGIIQRFALALPNGFALRCGYSRRAAELRSHPRFWPRRTFQFFSLSGFQLFLGGKGIRTPGLFIANEALYQLSYTPGRRPMVGR